MSNRVAVKLLPDKSGKVRIHWFVRDEKGPVTTPAGDIKTAMGPIPMGGTRGRIACQPRLTDVTPKMANGVMQLVPHSDDVRGVTCPECKGTSEYAEVQKQLAELLETANEGAPVKA